MALFFPCLISGPTEDLGVFVVMVPGPNINAQGPTEVDALLEAAEGLQEAINDAVSDGDPLPQPGNIEATRQSGDRLGVLQAQLPAQAA
ncbi:MAG: type II toxin-antitoxin system HicB family antitoxin [Pseudomonadota bacterium]